MSQVPAAQFSIPERVTGFVEGRCTGAGGYELEVIHPGDGRRIATLVESSPAEVDAAVRSARAAFEDGRWRRQTVEARQAVMRQVADLVDVHREELAYLECMNSGIPMRHLQRGQIPRTAHNFRFFAEFLGQHAGKMYDQTEGYLTLVLREPVGVAALIGPWNAPLALTSMKIAGAIAFGNSCVCKPSEVTPLAVARFMELLVEAGVPPGVVNLVNGRGGVTGEALVAHPGVDLVSFTGGTQTARRISASAGEGLKPLSLELGGKSANIIFESADLERAIDGALLGIFSNNGQQCLAGSRILVQRAVLDRFIESFVARTRRLRLGDPLDPATEIGPLAFRAHRDRVASYVEVARADGAQVLCGGQAEAALEPGFFFQPTAVLAQDNRARVCREEIFGPFATIVPFDTADQAFAMANDSEFGLVSYVWTDHHPTLMRALSDIRAGMVWANTPMTRDLRAPFGGIKSSGYGREGGESSMKFYTYEKTAMLPTVLPAIPRLGA
ncbi:Putative aldehyde dehydrogenase AldA [Pigmentiphaga humi]|uniref:Aldehyde dehydrogenase AldA n=1 Tax=Pigmentiphaga humi TaxID=2478468 RepID=A0A3P4AY88_9BURK|nr:aldehyde dehydrogenase [Pigmentiphaga humi]VCU68752.1 Putative aldehyde dehydrogenase AldA [Pigmentiphaga humi]